MSLHRVGWLLLQCSPQGHSWPQIICCKQNSSCLRTAPLDYIKIMASAASNGKSPTNRLKRPTSVEWGNGIGMIKLNPLSGLSPSKPIPSPVNIPSSALSLLSPTISQRIDAGFCDNKEDKMNGEGGSFSSITRSVTYDSINKNAESLQLENERMNNGFDSQNINSEMYDSGISLAAVSPKTDFGDIFKAKSMVQSMSSDSGWTMAGSETDGDQELDMQNNIKNDQTNADPSSLIHPPGVSDLNLRISATPPRESVPRSRSEPFKLQSLIESNNEFSPVKTKKYKSQDLDMVNAMLPIRTSGPPLFTPKKKKVPTATLR